MKMKKLVFAVITVSVLSTGASAGSWVKGKITAVRQWHTETIINLQDDAGTKYSAFTLRSMPSDGKKAILAAALTAQAGNKTTWLYYEGDWSSISICSDIAVCPNPDD